VGSPYAITRCGVHSRARSGCITCSPGPSVHLVRVKLRLRRRLRLRLRRRLRLRLRRRLRLRLRLNLLLGPQQREQRVVAVCAETQRRLALWVRPHAQPALEGRRLARQDLKQPRAQRGQLGARHFGKRLEWTVKVARRLRWQRAAVIERVARARACG